MKPLTTAALSTQLAVLIQLTAVPAAAQLDPELRGPVLIVQQGDTIPGTEPRVVDCLSGPVEAGGDNVGIAAGLSDGGEGALWVAHHSERRNTPILATDVGALYFFTNRFGLLAVPLWGSSEQGTVPFAVKAIMADGGRALLTNGGFAQRFGAGAPGLPKDTVITDVRRIQMLQNGETYWVAHWLGASESGKAFFRGQPGPRSSVDLLMNKGDAACGGVVEDLHHFRVAEHQNYGQVVDVRTEYGVREALYIDGQCPYVIGEPLPGGHESPTDFWHFDIDSAGHVLFGALTDGPDQQNAVLVLDGKVVMREGQIIDGVRIDPPNAQPNEVRLDDRGRAVTLWAGPAESAYTIFYTPDIEKFEDTRKVVSENTPLDFDGDGQAEATLAEFRFFADSGPTFSLADTGIYIAVWLRYPPSSELVPAVIFYPF